MKTQAGPLGGNTTTGEARQTPWWVDIPVAAVGQITVARTLLGGGHRLVGGHRY